MSKTISRFVIYGLLLSLGFYGFFIEPEWIVIKNVSLSSHLNYRLVHISDIHYKGDESFLNKVVERINVISPDFVCFTGDLIEEKQYLDEALRIIERINCPVYGVPGNHDYESGASFDEINKALIKTGGQWLVNQNIVYKDLEIIGISNNKNHSFKELSDHRILLTHYPLSVPPGKYHLILAGHSHGGQVRIPFIGSLKVPYGVGKYDKGLYTTEAGILYVNPGIGTYGLHLRLFCRPEITVIDV
jgi:hypothetical protein